LTWIFEAEGHRVWAMAPYAEPVTSSDGTVEYQIRRAAESGDEGLGCVDDAARAALLALSLYEREGSAQGGDALRWARRWLTLVRYMQLSDGRFANFVFDNTGRRNLEGPTSVPGGPWWTGRALWALARFHRLTHSVWALEAWARCPFPDLGEACNIKALFALAALELLEADPSLCPEPSRSLLSAQQARVRPLVVSWCEAIVSSGPDYFRDLPGQSALPLWGYHQLHAVARASAFLQRDDFVPPCAATVLHLAEPVVAAKGLYTFDPRTGGTKVGMCAYCMSPLVQGLAALYDLTGKARFRVLALDAASWLYGRNYAGATLYDPISGRCSDGLNGPAADRPSPNAGAESSIEAGFMEVERQRLAG
jgi:hypothetical protein